MKITFDEILTSMKTAFYNACGENPDSLGDVGARLQAVASELYSLACHESFILNQAFPQTASGEYLDYHADLRGIKRKEPTKASVKLTLSVDEASDTTLEIPAGLICACSDKPYLQYVTKTDMKILAGNISANVMASSLGCGDEYNVEAGKINVIVNPPARVTGVTNKSKATGGTKGETDEKLRRRILDSYRVLQTGMTLGSIQEVVQTLDFVLECRILKNENVYNVYIKTPNESLDYFSKLKISNKLGIISVIGATANIYKVDPFNVDISVACELDNDARDNYAEQIKTVVANTVDNLRIGDSLELSSIYNAVAKIDGIKELQVSSAQAVDGIVIISNNQYVNLNSVEVTSYE